MVKKTFNPKSLLQSSFQPILLDAPIRTRRKRIPGIVGIFFEKLPKPLEPAKYVPPKPIPKPKKKRPVALPRRRAARVPNPSVQKLIEEITPFYRPEAIGEFRERVTEPARGAQKKAFREELASKLRKRIVMKIKERKKGLKGVVQSFELENISIKDPRMLFATSQNSLTKKLAEILQQKGPFKAYLTLTVELKKSFIQDGGEAYEFTQPYFNSTTTTILNRLEIRDFYDKAVEDILNRIARWISKDSGWIIERILNFYLNIVSYVPLKGRSYLPLPEELRNSRKGLINLKNTDNKCFLWCHVRHLNPIENNPQRVKETDKALAKELDYTGVTFPVTIRDMGKIEKQNKININVFGYDEYVVPIRNSKTEYGETLNVLIIEGETKSGYGQHYVYIKDFNRLNFNITKHKNKKHFCLRCLQPFYSEDS